MDWMQIAEQMNKMSQFYQKPTPYEQAIERRKTDIFNEMLQSGTADAIVEMGGIPGFEDQIRALAEQMVEQEGLGEVKQRPSKPQPEKGGLFPSKRWEPPPSKRIPLGGFTKPIRKEKKDDLTYYTNY